MRRSVAVAAAPPLACASLLLAAACVDKPSPQQPDARAVAAVTARRTDASLADAREAAGDDAGAYTDGAATDARRAPGYIRFVHVAPGAGPVRFVAMGEREYASSRVEAVVAEGDTSGYLLAASVPHRVRVYAADAPPDGGAELAAPILSDVYNDLGCTVAFAGRSATGRRDAGVEARRLVRVVDVPRRADAGTVALVRYMHAVTGAGPLELREGDAVLEPALTYLDMTGLRVVAPGAHALTVAGADGGAAVEPSLAVTFPAVESHTLWLYGAVANRGRGARARAPDAGPTVTALVTRDIPGRPR